MTATKLKLFADDAAITKEIGAIKIAGAKLQNRIHVVAVSILARWAETGDRRPAIANINALLDAMPAMSRANALRQWVQLHFKLEYSEKKMAWPEGQSFTPDTEAVKAAADEPFWELAPEPEYKPVNFAALLSKLVKAAEKDLEKAAEKGFTSSVDAEKLAALKALAEG